jgi:ribosomal protein L34E
VYSKGTHCPCASYKRRVVNDETCVQCGKPLDPDDANYATYYGFMSTRYGNPYCDECLPKEPEKKCKKCGKRWQDAEDDLHAIILKSKRKDDEFVGFACVDCGMDVITGEPLDLGKIK